MGWSLVLGGRGSIKERNLVTRNKSGGTGSGEDMGRGELGESRSDRQLAE
jgi:hypothetical protein